MLEGNRGGHPPITPDLEVPPTLAEELSAWRAHSNKVVVLRPNPRPVTVKRVIQILYFELLNILMDWSIKNCEVSPQLRIVGLTHPKDIGSTYPPMLPWFVVPAFLVVLSITAVRVTHRIGNPVAGNQPTDLQAHSAPSQPIRDLLLGGAMGISNELAHNLIPKRI